MRRFLAALAALAFGLFSPARAQEAPRAATPREELESLTLLAARSMVQILEAEGRYQPFTPGAQCLPNERWLYAGERVARVQVEEFPEYFALERCQRELGLWVGADEAELDRQLAGWRVPRELARGAEALALRACAPRRASSLPG